MKSKSVKCENCGATMQTDTENAMRFCPFCGAAFEMPEDLVDLAKFQMRHEESVRQKIVQEEREKEKDNDRTFMKIMAVVFGVLLTIIAIIFIIKGSTNSGLEKTVAEVQQLIIDGNYDEALVRAQSIRVKKDGLFDENYSRWENQRKDLIRLIEQKKKESGQ